MEDPSFLDIEVSTLMAILDQDKLNIDSEMDLFNALLRFANERSLIRDDSVQNLHEQNNQNNSVNGGIGLIPVEEIKMESDVNAMMQGHEEEFSEENNEVNYNHHHESPSPDVVVVENELPHPVAPPANDQPSTSVSAANAAAAVAAVDNLNYFMDEQRLMVDEATLRQAVKKIRFLTMTPQQFADGPARSKLLQQHEALAILIEISSPSINDCPMPEGFCRSRCSRNYYEQRSNQRDLSSYRHSMPPPGSGNICSFAPMDSSMDHIPAQVLASTRANPCNNLPASNPNPLMPRVSAGIPIIPVSDNEVATNDTRRSYCVCTGSPQFHYRNTSVSDCGLTFQVDTNIWITGKNIVFILFGSKTS